MYLGILVLENLNKVIYYLTVRYVNKFNNATLTNNTTNLTVNKFKKYVKRQRHLNVDINIQSQSVY